MQISFLGACREVTGSNVLVEAGGKKILLDCGFFQGFKTAEERNFAPFAYKPPEIDFVVVCHAHLDHVGRLPKLYKEGFRGKIFSTAPTRELAQLVLEDTEKLMREESEREDHAPLYTKEHIVGLMQLFETISYGENLEVSPGVKIMIKNAGHILGSATCMIEADGVKLVYTSDLGNTPSLLLNPPETYAEADYVICESTYGGRIHEDVNKRREKLGAIINSTIVKNGVLMIPSFAIERTQELLHDIDEFCSIAGCDKPEFFLDSPLAEKATTVFRKYPTFLSEELRNEHKDNDFFGLDRIHVTSSVEQSKEIERSPNPKVIIAGSGMMNGGRILHHAIDFLDDHKNTLLIIGYQANGTLGRRLLSGDKVVRIFGKDINVGASVIAIGSYSAHADMPQLISWVSAIKNVKKVFLVHGESDQSLVLAREFKTKTGLESVVPQLGEKYTLT